jgi:WhiB family transcriptional regulator, redox-sensing transcriptional regulator
MTEPQRYEQWAAELDELAAVPTEVLADQVTARGRCLWEITVGDPPVWTGENDPDRELATRLCAGCLVRSECLEFELRLSGAQTLGVWGALNADDRQVLHTTWSSRRHEAATCSPNNEGDQQ